MMYRSYGTTGIKVSALGFGCMRFPMSGGQVRREEAISILHRAMDLGINYFDTAVMYCNEQSEEVLGEAIRGRRGELYISTKNHYKGDDPARWRRYLDQSLRRLGTDYIDFYHIHDLRLDEYEQHLLPHGAIKQAVRAKNEALIRHLCFSSHDDPQNIIFLIDTGLFEGLLVQYNILDRHNEEAIAYAHKKGLGVSIMGTVAGGRLLPFGGKPDAILSQGQTIPDLAIRFVLSNPCVSVALPGMETIQMVEENVASANRPGPLTPEENGRILQIVAQTERLKGLYCTGCNYCMPCPKGVDIPANFAAYNLARVWGLDEMAKTQYRALGSRKKGGKPAPAWAEACTGCGACEGKCPQDLQIAERLKEVKKVLGG